MENLECHKMERVLPEGAKVVKTVNGIDLYNINLFQNIMSRTITYGDIAVFDYHDNLIKYRDLPEHVSYYEKALDSLGVKTGAVVTVVLPPTVESTLALMALSNRGIISNNPNFLFVKDDLLDYTTNKNSDTIIILDMYLPFITDQIKNTNIKNVIITSLSDMLPEDQKDFYDDINKMPDRIKKAFLQDGILEKSKIDIMNLRGVEFIRMKDFIEVGKRSSTILTPVEVDIERDAIYSYTSGTTGKPKCIVYKEQSANAFLEMHNGVDLYDRVGDRSLNLIPSSHTTGMFCGLFLQMSRGKTIVPQPLYDKKTFAKDLEEKRINHALAAGSFYIEASSYKYDNPNALAGLNRPGCGGEPITLGNVNRINDWLKASGCNRRISLGGGTGELGSSVLSSYYSDSGSYSNETGAPIPGTMVRIVKENSNEEVEVGERGYFQASSPAQADRYLDNEEATNKAWFYENGTKWYNAGDIIVQNEDLTYSMLGRGTDSFVDENGVRQYLFDTEYLLEAIDPVKEWEISAFKDETLQQKIVAQIVLPDNYTGKKSDALDYLFAKYNFTGIKIYDKFESSEVTGKRNYKELSLDSEGYYVRLDENNYELVNIDGLLTSRIIVSKSSLDNNNAKILKK